MNSVVGVECLTMLYTVYKFYMKAILQGKGDVIRKCSHFVDLVMKHAIYATKTTLLAKSLKTIKMGEIHNSFHLKLIYSM